MKYSIRHASLVFPAFLFVFALSGKAENTPKASASMELERGSRHVASLSGAFSGAQDKTNVKLVEHPQDDGNLRLEIEGVNGKKVFNDNLVAAIDRDESDVESYGVTLGTDKTGAVVIRTGKDWGSSHWNNYYTISRQKDSYVLSAFEFQSKGKCSLNLLSGEALVNGHTKKFSVPETSLEKADGLELMKICQDLGAI